MKHRAKQKESLNLAVSVISRGDTVELCFTKLANEIFSLMYDTREIHLINIITFEFEEENLEHAFKIWLTLLMSKMKEHQLIFGDFRLKREGNLWKATVSGEPMTEAYLPNRKLSFKDLSLKKVQHTWEAHCFVCEGFLGT